MKVYITQRTSDDLPDAPEPWLTREEAGKRFQAYWDEGLCYNNMSKPIRRREAKVVGYLTDLSYANKARYYEIEVLPGLSEALDAFFTTIESTGGVIRNPKGYYEPGGDRDWIDLGQNYTDLCHVLGRKPMVRNCNESGLLVSVRKTRRKRKAGTRGGRP